MKSFLSLLTIGALVVSSFPAVAQDESAKALVGTYECRGKNPDGSEYVGKAEIAQIKGTFRIRWTLDDAVVMGVGILSDGVFAVSYFGGAPAVVVYKIDGSKMVGQWTMGGLEGATYEEVLTKKDSTPPNLNFQVTPPNPAPQPQRPQMPGGNPRTIRL
jgi:hypothetical protein